VVQAVKQAPVASSHRYGPHWLSGIAVDWQVPTLPTTSQASSGPVHAVSQQTPCAQKPLAHSEAALQVSPLLSSGAHAFAEQKKPVAHSLPVLHEAKQVPVSLHTYPPHSGSGVPAASGEQVPTVPGKPQAWQAPVHAALQQTPSAQKLL
jgi:hypothetical protein